MPKSYKYRVALSLLDVTGLEYVKDFRISLSPGEIIVGGRSTEAQFPVDDDNASRKHFFFDVKFEQVYINDMKSKNGVFLNNKRVQSSAISLNDFITIGHLTYLVKSIKKTLAASA